MYDSYNIYIYIEMQSVVCRVLTHRVWNSMELPSMTSQLLQNPKTCSSSVAQCKAIYTSPSFRHSSEPLSVTMLNYSLQT